GNLSRPGGNLIYSLSDRTARTRRVSRFKFYTPRVARPRHLVRSVLAFFHSRVQFLPMVHVTYYLEVMSSWCYWAEPAWKELKERFAGRAVFDWKIALMPPEAYPVSAAQLEWFYRRSGSIVRSPFMLDSGWFEPELKQYLAPNYIALAGRELGITDDRVRLALAQAGMREGKKVGRWEVAIAAAAPAVGLDPARLLARAQSPDIAAKAQATTDEFFALKVSQRPAFLIESSIGDRAVFSGIVRVEPLAAAIEAALADEAAYGSWKAHFGDPPGI
ncbi:MAG TPA: DsbA family protein, partial [Verrucomicrobiae bacterium]|nr:DsbA family protein [Verrucomicrobiae bacterium]